MSAASRALYRVTVSRPCRTRTGDCPQALSQPRFPQKPSGKTRQRQGSAQFPPAGSSAMPGQKKQRQTCHFVLGCSSVRQATVAGCIPPGGQPSRGKGSNEAAGPGSHAVLPWARGVRVANSPKPCSDRERVQAVSPFSLPPWGTASRAGEASRDNQKGQCSFGVTLSGDNATLGDTQQGCHSPGGHPERTVQPWGTQSW